MFPDSFCIGSSQSSGFIVFGVETGDGYPSLPALVLFPSSSSSSLRVVSLHRQKHGMEGEGAGGNGVERGRQTDRSGGKEGRKAV